MYSMLLICQNHSRVQETVEPLMEQYKPPGLIKKMYFKNLSFGDAPFKIENIWVEDEGEKHVLMEVNNQFTLYIHVCHGKSY